MPLRVLDQPKELHLLLKRANHSAEHYVFFNNAYIGATDDLEGGQGDVIRDIFMEKARAAGEKGYYRRAKKDMVFMGHIKRVVSIYFHS